MLRASFNTCLGLRPKSASMCCSFANNVSGDSAACGSTATTRLRRGGGPGGQSVGAVLRKEDVKSGLSERVCNLSIARRTVCIESPRLDPMATMASEESFTARLSLKAEHVLH